MKRDFVKFFNFLKMESRRSRKARILFERIRSETQEPDPKPGVKSLDSLYLLEISHYIEVPPVKKAFEVFSSIILPEQFDSKDKLDILFCDILLITLEIVKNPRVPELLQRLSRESKCNLIAGFILSKDGNSFTSHLTGNTNFSLLSMLELLEESNETEIEMVGNLYNYKRNSTSIKTNKDIQKYGELSYIFFSSTTTFSMLAFRNFIGDFTRSGLKYELRFIEGAEAPAITTLLLLRKIYGEDVVVDVLKRINSEKIEWNDCNIVKFVREWDEIKDYPLSWTLSLVEG